MQLDLGSEYNPVRYYIGEIPTRIACFQSKSKRFPPLATEYGTHIGPGAYWPDERQKNQEGEKKKKPFPMAAFKSGTSRFMNPSSKPIVEPKYKLENDARVWTSDGKFFTVTKTTRFNKSSAPGPPGMSTLGNEGFHSAYDTDTAHASKFSSIGRWVSTSSQKYSNISSTSERFSDISSDSEMGPGYYDPRPASSISAGLQEKRGSACFQSNTNRFMVRINVNPSSTYSLETDKKTWGRHGYAWSTQERFGGGASS